LHQTVSLLPVVRALLFGANPVDNDGHALRLLPYRELFVGIESLVRQERKWPRLLLYRVDVVAPKMTFVELSTALTDKTPQVLHLYVHGSNEGDFGILRFEDDGGKEHKVDGEVFATLLAAHLCVKIVVLTVCEAGGKITQRLLADGFQGAIVAVESRVNDPAITDFCSIFYTALRNAPLPITLGQLRAMVTKGNTASLIPGQESAVFKVFSKVWLFGVVQRFVAQSAAIASMAMTLMWLLARRVRGQVHLD